MVMDIILPTYNNLDELKICLDGLARQTNRSFTAIICVDGSTDGTVEYLSSARYPFRFVVAEHPDRKNHGRNPARNLALPHVSAEYLLLLDSDSLPAPDLIEAHLRLLVKEECVSLGAFIYTNTGTNIWARYAQSRGRQRMPDGEKISYRFFNSGNAAFRTRYFIELGGQDPLMTRYGGGDTEFAIRLYDRYHISFVNNTGAIATSCMNKDIATALNQYVEFGRHNLRYLYEKHPAHRHLYGMSQMIKYPLLFSIMSQKLFVRFVVAVAPAAPRFFQKSLVRFLVIANLYRGFSAR